MPSRLASMAIMPSRLCQVRPQMDRSKCLAILQRLTTRPTATPISGAPYGCHTLPCGSPWPDPPGSGGDARPSHGCGRRPDALRDYPDIGVISKPLWLHLIKKRQQLSGVRTHWKNVPFHDAPRTLDYITGLTDFRKIVAGSHQHTEIFSHIT